MKWFVAKLVFRIICGEGLHTPQFEEQVRLIQAATAPEAFESALAFGKNEEQSFYNKALQLVKWEFINVSELMPVNEPEHGLEITSAIREVDQADNYLALIYYKATALQKKYSNGLLTLA